MSREELVTNKDLECSFNNTHYGSSPNYREIVLKGLEKVKQGWHNGYTTSCILVELGLTKKLRPRKYEITQKGKNYLKGV